MSIKPQYETYRYTGEVCRLHSQSMVECRLPGSEIGAVLAVQAVAMPTESTCADGEIRYGGKLFISIVYEDGERNVCRAERGVEFFHKAESSAVTPACFAKVAFNTDNVFTRREGSGLYVSVVADAESVVYGGKQVEYLSGGEQVIAKKEQSQICKCVCVTGEVDGEDTFETEYVGDVLMHTEKVVATHVRAAAGQIEIEGELALNVCVLKADNSLCSYERILPVRMQIPSEEAFGDLQASARVIVKSAQINADVDEERGKSNVQFVYCLSADCYLHAKDTVTLVTDAFSPACELTIKKVKDGGRYLTNSAKFSERVSGICSVSVETDGENTLVGAVLPRGEVVCKKGENGFEAEGAVLAQLLFKCADGSYKTGALSLPFVFPLDVTGDSAEADVLVCGLNVRRRKDGQTEAEATLKVCLHSYTQTEWSYVQTVEEGDARAEKDAAVSMYALYAGETLWDVAKRLQCDPDELVKSNPDLQFPVKQGESIFIYRQLR